MEIIPDKRKLVGIIEQANDGRLCLPDFQRDFVWTREQVADLLRSVVRGYFIGTLLLLRSDPQNPPFAPLFVRGAKPLHREPHPELLALDGQQRVSSLLYALTAPDFPLKDTSQRRWFFLDLRLLLEDKDDDSIVVDRSRTELNGLLTTTEQYKNRLMPFTALLTNQAVLDWLFGMDDFLSAGDPAEHQQYKASWRARWTEAATGFQNFEIPLVELPKVDDRDPDSIGRVCAIFEKLNSTGTELSVYDLLTARLYRHGIRLHDLWDAAVEKCPRLAKWSDKKADNSKFGVLLLRVLALRRGLEVKPKVLIDLKPEGFADDFMRAAQAMEKALEIVELVGEDGFGVFDRKWLPGFALLPVLAALRAEVTSRKDLGEQERADIRHWFWSNVFLERYSSAVESKSRKDYMGMLTYWSGGRVPSVFGEAAQRIGSETYTVRDSASTGSAVYSGVFCLLAKQGARDWRLGEDIQLQQLQDHHIFPQAYLRTSAGLKERIAVNTIANRTLISDLTNQKISDRAPASYLADPAIFPGGPTSRILDPHFINDEVLEVMRQATDALDRNATKETYQRFGEARERAIIEAVRRAAGIGVYDVQVAPEDEADEEGEPEIAVGLSSRRAETKGLQLEFWKAFVDYMRASGTPLRLPRPHPQHWFNVSLGRPHCTVCLIVDTGDQELRCKIVVDTDDRDQLFDALLGSKGEIETALGELEWDAQEGRRSRQIGQRRPGDIRDRTQWPELFAWLKDRAEAFVATFGPRVASESARARHEVALRAVATREARRAAEAGGTAPT